MELREKHGETSVEDVRSTRQVGGSVVRPIV